jgi:hypothetical protein
MRVAADNARRLLDRLGRETVVAERQAITSELLWNWSPAGARGQ